MSRRGGVIRLDDVEVSWPVVDGHQSEVKGLRGGSSAVLDSDGEVITEAADVDSAVGPSVEVSRPAEGLTGVYGTTLLGVMDDDDGDVVLALHLAKEGEESGDIGGTIFVDAVKANERIEEEHAGRVGAECAVDAGTIAVEIEAESGSGDDIERNASEVETAVAAEPGEAELEISGSILGEVDKSGAWVVHGEAA